MSNVQEEVNKNNVIYMIFFMIEETVEFDSFKIEEKLE